MHRLDGTPSSSGHGLYNLHHRTFTGGGLPLLSTRIIYRFSRLRLVFPIPLISSAGVRVRCSTRKRPSSSFRWLRPDSRVQQYTRSKLTSSSVQQREGYLRQHNFWVGGRWSASMPRRRHACQSCCQRLRHRRYPIARGRRAPPSCRLRSSST
jgi:hypothetical protein